MILTSRHPHYWPEDIATRPAVQALWQKWQVEPPPWLTDAWKQNLPARFYRAFYKLPQPTPGTWDIVRDLGTLEATLEELRAPAARSASMAAASSNDLIMARLTSVEERISCLEARAAAGESMVGGAGGAGGETKTSRPTSIADLGTLKMVNSFTGEEYEALAVRDVEHLHLVGKRVSQEVTPEVGGVRGGGDSETKH